MTTRTPNGDDILVWADDYWCFRREHTDSDSRSDDFEVFYIDTPEHDAFLSEQEY